MFNKNKITVEINKRRVCDKLWEQYLYYDYKEFEVKQLAFKEKDPKVKSKLEELATGYRYVKENAFTLSHGIDWLYSAGNMLTFSR